MVDTYMGAGRRNRRAREQARAFKTPEPVGGFVAPGYPVEPLPPPVSPPPPIVPVVGGGGAAAGGAAAPVVGLAVVGGAAYLLSRDVKRDIDRFKKTARLPFYDGLRPMTERDWAQAKPAFDAAADAAAMFRADAAVNEYNKAHQADYSDWLRGAPNWHWSYMRYSGNRRFGPHNNGRFSAFVGYEIQGGWSANDSISHTNWHQEWNSVGLGVSPFFIFQPGDPVDPAHGTGRPVLPAPATQPSPWAEYWVDPDTLTHPSSNDQYERTVGNVWRRRFFAPSVYLGDGLGHGRSATPWRDAVAPPGSQPSLAQQQARARLPRGSPRTGYYVLPPLNYPITEITTEPGTPPVTVPGILIEPGAGVTLIPPGANDWGNPDEHRERKPRHRFNGAMFINIMTETNDFFKALHKGLPKKLRSKKKRWGIVPIGDIVLRDIWDHWDQFDADKALQAVINNEIQDRLLGKYFFGQISKRAHPYAKRAAQLGLGKAAGYVPIPEVHVDGDGTIEITVNEKVIASTVRSEDNGIW